MKKSIFSKSIRNRFIIAIGTLTLVFFSMLIIGTSLLEINRIKTQLNNELTLHAKNKVEQFELRVSYLIESIQRFASSSLAINSLIDASGRSSYFPLAIAELESTEDILSVVAFDFAGRVIATDKNTSTDWFKEDVIIDALTVGKTNLQFSAPLSSFILTVPILYYDTQQGGVAILISAEKIFRSITAVDDVGYTLTIGDSWSLTKGDFANTEIVMQAELHGDSILSPFLFSLSSFISNEKYEEPVFALFEEMLILGMIGIILIIALAARVGSSLATPIVRLISKVQNGEHPSSPVGTGDELELLAIAFDIKTQRLLDTKNTLEERVKLRTEEIEEKSRSLEIYSRELEHAKSTLEVTHLELKKTDKLKDEFISVVSHELRTPLTSIYGILKLLDAGVMDGNPDKSKEMVKIATANSKRLNELINDLLDFQKLTSGKFELSLESVSIKDILSQALERNYGYCQQFDVEIKLDGTGLSDIFVMVDAHRLHQVIDNFVSNAVKFSPKGGVVEISADINDGFARVSVRDHGTGIPEEFKKKIFSPFCQADSSSNRKVAGTGLGLSVCKGIIDSHGGKLYFDNAIDGGAIFWFEVPTS